MVNELPAKFVCFNLTRVILSQVELGNEPELWKDEPDGPRDILSLRCAG
jgi:hypothetical protein